MAHHRRIHRRLLYHCPVRRQRAKEDRQPAFLVVGVIQRPDNVGPQDPDPLEVFPTVRPVTVRQEASIKPFSASVAMTAGIRRRRPDPGYGGGHPGAGGKGGVYGG